MGSREISLSPFSVIQRLRAASPAIPNGIAGRPPAGLMACTSVKTPWGVIWTIILMGGSVKYRFPSGPAVIACGWALAVGTVNSVIPPLVVTRPMMFSNLAQTQHLNHEPPTAWNTLLSNEL